MYREQIKVFDCTVRDGGLINDHYFTDDFVRAVYQALSKSGVDYMEFGYRSSRELFPPEDYGAWKYCDDEKIRQVIDGIESDTKISVMVDSYRVKEQQLAYANTIEGIIHDANYVDGSLYGIGRGPGNCCLELLIGFLKNPKFNLTPILKLIQDYMIPMRNEIEWGYIIPYFITGILNEHPRSAIAYRKTEDKDKYAEFYEKMRLPQE